MSRSLGIDVNLSVLLKKATREEPEAAIENILYFIRDHDLIRRT